MKIYRHCKICGEELPSERRFSPYCMKHWLSSFQEEEEDVEPEEFPCPDLDINGKIESMSVYKFNTLIR